MNSYRQLQAATHCQLDIDLEAQVAKNVGPLPGCATSRATDRARAAVARRFVCAAQLLRTLSSRLGALVSFLPRDVAEAAIVKVLEIDAQRTDFNRFINFFLRTFIRVRAQTDLPHFDRELDHLVVRDLVDVADLQFRDVQLEIVDNAG